jgi:hypothetical protein
MNISPSNEKIEKYLDELASEYKMLLYKALVSRSKPLDELSVSELLRLDNEIKKPLFEDYQRQQRRRRMLFIIGLTYMFMGVVCYFLFKTITGERYDIDTVASLMSGVVGIIGMFIALYSLTSQTLSIFPKKYIKSHEKYTALLEYEVVAKWRELEGIVNDISLNANVKTPRSSIDFLLENHFIDEKEHIVLKDFLKMRNNIVHSSNNSYSESEIKEIIDEVNKIIDRIKKIM